MKRFTAFILICAILARQPLAYAEEPSAIVLPEPALDAEGQLIGDDSEPVSRSVTLFYPNEDGSALTALSRTVSAPRGKAFIESLVFDLLDTSRQRNSLRVWSPEIALLNVEYACGTVTLSLSIDAGVRQNDFSYLLLCRSLADTLLLMDDIQAVNILTMQRSERLCGLPTGVFTASDDGISTQYALLQSEDARAKEDAAPVSRSALLYFPSKDGQYLLPEVRSIRFAEGDCIPALLSALSNGPTHSDCCFSPIPQSLELLAHEATIQTDESGKNVAILDFSDTAVNYLAFSGTESWQLYACVVLTLCSFVPELDGVQLLVSGEPVPECSLNGETLRFENGVARREDFSHRIGSCSPVYYASNAKLVRSSGAVSQAEACSAKGVLKKMIAARPSEEGLESVFPDDILPGDILGVKVQGGVATVNLSANFYARCQSLNADEERLLIYAMVNALCALDQIGSVRFLIEGKSVESLAQSIYLKSALMPNPNLESEQ